MDTKKYIENLIKEEKTNKTKVAKAIGENPRTFLDWFKSPKGSMHIFDKLVKHFNIKFNR